MIYVQSLTLHGCFHIYLLEGESFPGLNLKVSLTNACTARISDVTSKGAGPRVVLAIPGQPKLPLEIFFMYGWASDQ